MPWRSVKSFEFVVIDMNHKFYGYSKEVNDRFELKMKTSTIPVNCIVNSEELKERLKFLLEEKIKKVS